MKLLGFLFRSSREALYSRTALLFVLFASLVAGLANTALIALTNRFVIHPALTQGWGGVFLALCLTLPAFRFISRALLIRLTQDTLIRFRADLCRQILSSPLRQIEQLGTSRLQSALISDLVRITDALALVPELTLHLVVVIGCLIYLGTLSWALLLLLLGLMALGTVTYLLPTSRAMRYQSLARDQWDVVFDDIRGVTQGAKELKMHRLRREGVLRDDLGSSTEALRRHSVRAGVLFSLAVSWGHVLFFAMIGALLFIAPSWSSFPREALTGFTLVIIYLMSPLEVILSTLPQVSSAEISVRNLEKLGLSLSMQTVEADAPMEARRSWRSIELAGVTHAYHREGEEDRFLLGPIDLTLRPGELVFLIGGNGSGKTTLAKILLGLYAPESGEVRLDGVPLDDSSRDAYRQLFSVVFADYFLFRRLAGLESSGLDDQALHYLTRLRLQNKVRVLGGELSSLDLSQGQRKRLALLTAYLEDRPIYLFDEWASDQDPAFKSVFYHELLPELKARGKTVIVISHDDHFYSQADRIVKLTDGAIEYDGPASSLLEPSVHLALEKPGQSSSHA